MRAAFLYFWFWFTTSSKCSWCGRVMRQAIWERKVSHGQCPLCAEVWRGNLRRLNAKDTRCN